MAIKTILDLLKQKPYVNAAEMERALACSKRQVSKYISYLRRLERSSGFRIVTVKNQGYQVIVDNPEAFEAFEQQILTEQPNRMYKKEHRHLLIVYLLLKNKDYIAVDQISQVLDVSKNTIVSDLNDVRRIVKEYDVELSAKKHYGIRLCGREQDIRQLFSHITGSMIDARLFTEKLFFLSSEFDLILDRRTLTELLKMNDFVLNDNMIDSLLMHIQILIYRIRQGNFINELSIRKDLIDHHSYRLALNIVSHIQKQTAIVVPNSEVDLLASQIVGKAPSAEVPAELRDDYRQKIVTALSRVDADYATNYAKDVTLIEYLLLHIYPLLKRVAFQLELKNSLIEAVSAQYANQFIVAMRFIEYHPDLSLHQLSRDEIGYIALHFAAHQERENQFSFKKIEKILLVGDFRQSNLILAKSKLLTYFPNAKVLSRTKSALSGLVSGEVDLVLVLDDKDLPPLKAVCVRISEGLSEDDFIRIRNMLLLNQDFLQNKPLRGIADLFFEELFFVEEHTDYEAILSKYATILADRHYADPSYRQSVLEREKRFSTVFENGVAGPHGMDQKALIDSIAVIILKNTAFYRGKPVRLIFMINIKQGHLFIHQEISDCLLKIMGDEALVNRLCQTDKFTEFQMYLERLM